MGGQILYLTDMVDKRTMEKFEREAKEAGRESWYLSWALDSTPQERAKVIVCLRSGWDYVTQTNFRARQSKSAAVSLRPRQDGIRS